VSKIGKITIFVDQTRNAESLSIRTTGVVGTVSLSMSPVDQQFVSRSPSPDAATFWKDILTKAATLIV